MRLALALGRQGRRGVVINADSAQVYADLAVLSARPSIEEMQGVEHRLFGAWDGARACSAADWARAASAEIAEVHAGGGVPILAGGTGLYIRILLEGIAPVPPIEPDVRAKVRAMSVAEAHAALTREDPERAALLAPADTARVTRALEVVRSTGKPLAHWQAVKTGGIGGSVSLHPLIILPERQALYDRCDLRFARMLAGGAVEEVKALRARQLEPALPVMRAIGVPEIAAYLDGSASLQQAELAGAQATRNYAKRQYTWLRNQLPANWPRIGSFDVDIRVHFERLLQH